MAEDTGWQMVVGQHNIGPQATILNARQRKLSFKVDDSASLEFVIDGTDPIWEFMKELSSDVWVLRNNRLFFRGRVGPTADALDADTNIVTVNVFDYKEWLGRQILGNTAPLSWRGKTRAVIIQSMLDYLNNQTGVKPFISLDSTKLTANTGDYDVLIDTSIKDAIAGMTGFGWQVVPTDMLNIAVKAVSPFYYVLNDYFVAEYGGAIEKISRSLDTASFANRVFATGDMALTPVEVNSTTLTSDIRGPMGSVVSDPEIIAGTALTSLANQELTDRSLLRADWDCTLVPGAWINDNDAWLGDIVRFVVKHGRLNINDMYRVTEFDLALSDDGMGQEVTMKLVKPPYVPTS